VGFDVIQIIRRPEYVRELNLANLVILLLYIPVIALYVGRRWRTLSYITDRRAADTIGKQVLLTALAKYGETIAVTGYPRKRFHLWPAVSQRIERLQRSR
jgi:hypothetical protein